MALKKIKIKDLRLGMFVSELDISWVKSPFFRHKRLILKQEDIDLLRQAGVEILVIDISKSQLTRSTDRPGLPKSEPETGDEGVELEPALRDLSDGLGGASSEVKSGVETKPKVPLRQELEVAKRIQSEVLNAVGEIQSAFERGHTVSLDKVNPIVEKTLESIDNNGQAIMALLHEGRDGGKIAMHSFGVFALVLLLSNLLEYDAEDQQLLGLAALTHDAGWTKLPAHLMSKGKPYSPQEAKLIRQHIPIVVKMLASQPDMDQRVVQTIEQHHEFMDGSGYPKNLKADEISGWARVLATCNEYDEMVHGMGESPGMTPQNALSALFQLSQKGKLDPFFTTKLISLLGVYPLGSAVELEDKRVGVVIETQHQTPLKPKIRLFYDEEGAVLPHSFVHNLASSDDKIGRVLDLYGKDKSIDPHNILIFTSSMLE